MHTIDHHLTNIDATLPVVAPAPSRAEVKANARHVRRIAGKRFLRLQQHHAALEHIAPLPEPGYAVHGCMSGTYSAWSLATACIELLGTIDELTIGTLGFNRDNCRDLCAMLDAGTVRRCTLVVSDYFRSSDRTIFADCRRDLESRGQRVVVCRSHAKLLLFSADGRQIVVETSANLRSSQNFEQFSIIADAELLAFHRTWLTELTETTP